jgi:hypothetical protein
VDWASTTPAQASNVAATIAKSNPKRLVILIPFFLDRVFYAQRVLCIGTTEKKTLALPENLWRWQEKS